MLNPPLQRVGHVTLDIIRTSKVTMERGRPVPGISTVVKVVCSVQPILKSSDTRILPEGDRSKACLKIYTRGAALFSLREGDNGHSADRFYWEDDLYEVMKVEHYAMGVLNHYKAICMRVELT